VISFGVAPAVIGYTLGLRGGWDVLCLTYLVVCGVSRLARFNVTAASLADTKTGKVKYFEGTPIPTTIAIVGMWAVAFALDRTGERLWFGVVHIGPWMLAPAGADLRSQWQRDDQRHAARSQTVTVRSVRLSAGSGGSSMNAKVQCKMFSSSTRKVERAG
jgi:hypothetical protein